MRLSLSSLLTMRRKGQPGPPWLAGLLALVLGSVPMQAAHAATVVREIFIRANADRVWDAIRDVGAPDRRLAPGVIVSARVQDGIRTLVFADGRVAREAVISVDDRTKRFAFSMQSSVATHHNGVMQVFKAHGGSRLVWTTDVLPDKVAPSSAAFMEMLLPQIKATLEKGR